MTQAEFNGLWKETPACEQGIRYITGNSEMSEFEAEIAEERSVIVQLH